MRAAAGERRADGAAAAAAASLHSIVISRHMPRVTQPCIYMESQPAAINRTIKRWQEATQPYDTYKRGAMEVGGNGGGRGGAQA